MKGKKILITGVCGTVGSELIKQLILNNEYSPKKIIGLDNNESALFFIAQEYQDFNNVSFYISDVRDKDDLINLMKGVDIVFHVAALKHVILNEFSPNQTVNTNIIGVQNIIDAANINNVEKVIFTSSDKAVNPTNVMGTSKLMGERLITAANSFSNGKGPIFSSTRFGNILGSNGSVMEIFHSQISKGGPITLTDPNMTRFVMNVRESVELILKSTKLAKGGEVFITKMPIIKIIDLAQVMIEQLAPVYGFNPSEIEIKEIGVKPGEKLYEELMSDEETGRAIELSNYFSVLPAFKNAYKNIKYNYKDIISTNLVNPYVSKYEKPLNKKELLNFLNKSCLISRRV